MTLITVPVLDVDPLSFGIAAGQKFLLALGTRSADGSDAVDLANVGLIGKKFDHNCFEYTYGVVNGASGPGPDAHIKVDQLPFMELSLFEVNLEKLLQFSNRAAGDLTATGIAPNIVREIGNDEFGNTIVTGVQAVADLPGLPGAREQIQFFNATLMLPSPHSIDAAVAQGREIPARIEACRDPGAETALGYSMFRIIHGNLSV